MIIKIVISLLIVVIAAYVANKLNNVWDRKNRQMSFRESMDLAEMPVVTFYQGENKFNFLLDTGSNLSHISTSAASKLIGEKSKTKAKVAGIGGEATTSGIYHTTLSYKDSQYEIDLCVTDHLNQTFAEIKKESGVQVHGIIGNQFFQKHKYILDFKNLVAYTKK